MLMIPGWIYGGGCLPGCHESSWYVIIIICVQIKQFTIIRSMSRKTCPEFPHTPLDIPLCNGDIISYLLRLENLLAPPQPQPTQPWMPASSENLPASPAPTSNPEPIPGPPNHHQSQHQCPHHRFWISFGSQPSERTSDTWFEHLHWGRTCTGV